MYNLLFLLHFLNAFNCAIFSVLLSSLSCLLCNNALRRISGKCRQVTTLARPSATRPQCGSWSDHPSPHPTLLLDHLWLNPLNTDYRYHLFLIAALLRLKLYPPPVCDISLFFIILQWLTPSPDSRLESRVPSPDSQPRVPNMWVPNSPNQPTNSWWRTYFLLIQADADSLTH